MFETIAVLTAIALAVVFVVLFQIGRASRREEGEESKF